MAFMSLTGWAQDISECDITIDGNGIFTYSGSKQTVSLIVKMAGASTKLDASAYDVVFYAANGTTAVAADDLIDAGSYYVAAKGKAPYTGETQKLAFKINAYPMTGDLIAVTTDPTTPSYAYDGTAKTIGTVTVKFGPTSTAVTLGEDDYTISYENNINAGAASAADGPKLVVTGKGNFGGEKKIGFAITAGNLPALSVTGAYTFTAVASNPVYTGEETTTLPTIVVKNGTKTLEEDTDYEIRWYAAGASDYLKKNVGTTASPVYVKVNPTDAGTYTAKVFGKGNYNEGSGITGADPAWTLTVAQAPITVAIKDATAEYSGNPNKDQNLWARTTGNLLFSGIVAADAADANTIKGKFVISAATAQYTGDDEAIIPGDYELTLGGVSITTSSPGKAANYKIENYTPGKLTVTPKVLQLKASDETKQIGKADPAFKLTSTATGVTGHKIVGVTFTREKQGTEDGEKAGDYLITPDWSAAKVLENEGTTTEKEVTDYYSFALATTKGVLTIEPGGIIVTILDAEKFYGQADPEEFAYTVTGLLEGEELAKPTITRSKAGAADGEEPGTYSLTATVENPDPTKYASISVANGIFTIKKAHLEFTLPTQNLAVNNTKTALSQDDIEVTGFFKAEDEAVVKTLYTLDFNVSTSTTPADGSLPSNELTTSGALQTNNKTYTKGYKATLTTDAAKHYDIFTGLVSSVPTYETFIAGKIIVGEGSAVTTGLVLDIKNATVEDRDVLKLINDHAGETQTVKIKMYRTQTIGGKERKWAKGIWNCMVLPFKTNTRAISKALGYAIVNVVNPSETTEGNVKFKLNMYDEIPANTPFFVKTDADIEDGYEATFSDVKIEAAEATAPVAASSEAIGYKFVGAYTKKTITGNNEEHLRFRLGNVDSWNKIGNGSSATWDIVPFNAYMDLGATAGAREVIFTFEELDGSFTAIRSIDIDKQSEGAKAADGWYNLNGMKLQGAPVQKGVYIKDGKKIVVK